MTASNSIRLGISACIVGQKVRFDAGHKVSRFVTQELGEHFEFVPVCPEVGIGLPVPRPTIRLISDDERIALVDSKDSSIDHTEKMMTFSRKKVKQLSGEELCGYIVCAKSPTCGMERVKVYKKNRADKEGVGLYTAELMRQMPWLPVEEDGRLNDPYLRENFISRVYCLKDLYDSMQGIPTPGKLVAFHSRYKLTLMAHDPVTYRKLGHMVANIRQYDINEFFSDYRIMLMQALSNRASRRNNTNVLMHIQGYFKRFLSAGEKQELARVIREYRRGELPILAPLTLIRHYMGLHPNAYLGHQSYFDPHPQSLKLRLAL